MKLQGRFEHEKLSDLILRIDLYLHYSYDFRGWLAPVKGMKVA